VPLRIKDICVPIGKASAASVGRVIVMSVAPLFSTTTLLASAAATVNVAVFVSISASLSAFNDRAATIASARTSSIVLEVSVV
jgi:uncharacterized membrane protein YdfJ with MMPL/SSD domain